MRSLNFFSKTLPVALILALCACSQKSARQQGSTDSLQGLQAMAYSGSNTSTSKHKNIRVLAIKETALSIGAQAGLASRAKQIDTFLTKQNRLLDKVYGFDALLLDNNVLPPVLLEGQNTLNYEKGNAIRLSDRTYKISRQARFVTTAPNWRQYIWMDYKLPDTPDVTLLPKTAEERSAWKEYTYQGWQKGIEQADTIFADNLARLKQDYVGMILYRKLLAMNMVSPPYVSHTELGVTGDSSEIHIDDRVLRITALPGLKPDSSEWRATISKDEDALKSLRHLEKLAGTTKIEITDKAWQPVIPHTS